VEKVKGASGERKFTWKLTTCNTQTEPVVGRQRILTKGHITILSPLTAVNGLRLILEFLALIRVSLQTVSRSVNLFCTAHPCAKITHLSAAYRAVPFIAYRYSQRNDHFALPFILNSTHRRLFTMHAMYPSQCNAILQTQANNKPVTISLAAATVK